ncbi:hypothetical protein CLV28_1177 [Sediminihabitans luteus]|uniref:Lipoprotein n=1 Tax=Sediminihabitans luteus TaxID=1138585 RepID=A0A2M9D1A9_9CELL|nr:hypothetical protein [Sediminihabitans luteus]PJJ77950.1 hypothetical protein CLV28_1177 [Sediminihabitans luteus]
MRSSSVVVRDVGVRVGPLVLAGALLAGCSSDAEASPASSSGPRFTALDTSLPGWFEATPDLSAEVVATAYAASAPTTLRAGGEVRVLDHRGASPDEVVEAFTSGDGSEVMTDAAKAQMVALVEATSVQPSASVEVTPCEDAGIEPEQPHEIWSDAEAGTMIARSCVYVVVTPADPDAPQTETLEGVVLTVEVPDDDTALGTGATSGVAVLDTEVLHAIEDSGLSWYEYVADRL